MNTNKLIDELNELYVALGNLVNNDYDKRDGDTPDMEEAKNNLYGDAVKLMLSIDWVLNEYEEDN